MGDKKKVLANISYLSILHLINYVIPLVLIPYLVRVIGIDKYGIVAQAQAISLYFVMFTDYGFGMTATRKISINRKDKSTIDRIFSNVMTTKLLLLILSFVIYSLIILLLPNIRANEIAYFYAFLNVVGTVLFPVWLFQGLEQMKYTTILNIIPKIISLIAILMFVHNSTDFLLVILIQSLGTIFSGLLSIWISCRWFKINYKFVKWKEIISELKEGKDVVLSSLFVNLYNQGSVIITGYFTGNIHAGYFSIAQKVSGTISALVDPFVQGIYPYLCNVFQTNEKSYYRNLRMIKKYGLLVSILVGILVFVLAPFISLYFTGERIYELILIMRLFSITTSCVLLNILMNPVILSLGAFSDMRKMYVDAGLFFIVTSIPLTFYFGVIGATLCLLIISILIFLRSFKIIRGLI